MKFFSYTRFDTLRQRLDQHLAVDLRSLAMFRVGLGLTLLADLFIRYLDVESLYSGSGVLPLEALAKLPHLTWDWWLSINVISDSVVWQQLCFFSGMVFAALLMIGWKTRWIAPVMLLLLHSIQARNPWVNYAADRLLFLLLLWSCFLPLDRYWAVSKSTSVSIQKGPERLSSWGGWGLRLLPCVMYLFSVLRKSGSTWSDGTALRYVLEIDQFAAPFGIWLKAMPDFLLQCLTWSALAIELFAPFLLLMRGLKWRWLGIGLLLVFQCSLWCSLDLGIFPWVSILALLPHIPFPPRRSSAKQGAESILTSEISNLKGGHRLVGWLLVFMLIWNVLMTWNYPDSLKAQMPRWVATGISLSRMDQYWGMFSPDPMTLDGWYVIAAELDDGNTVDLLDCDRKDIWGKPANVIEAFPGDRWKEFTMRLFDYPDQAKLWEGVIRHFQNRWESDLSNTSRVQSATVYYMLEKTTEEGVLPLEREQLWPEVDEFP
ncbi:lipase maturation factor family protein [Verrucomicrobia bacterium]|nr:lipase maturation factor family protein [Verrucomicrobiota bacterium]MDA7682374.1 lipase maturation factor family protein [bacterium]MDB4589228.1 lipase maturation factor family protein [bacterium]MDB4619429.1 lipase maturation factor family protein [bacterium]MDB4705095.1 lipase maturation factor family protein [Verrucomicrobiota bacterium]